MTYEFLQHYWCFVVALLGALLVFLLFVQGANSCIRSLGWTEEGKRLIDEMLQKEDPEAVFFVIGHALRGYEEYLVKQNAGRFRVFAMVPSMLTEDERRRLAGWGVRVRVAIEPVPMGTYKSFAYEIFKRRPSRLIAFDGNIAGANLIQEAKNSRYPCQIYVSRRCKPLRIKAESLEGYVKLF